MIEAIYKTETDSQTQKTNRATKGDGEWGRGRSEVWDQQMQTTRYKINKQQGPVVYSTRNYTQYPVTNNNGK